jgi:hypothetical protein
MIKTTTSIITIVAFLLATFAIVVSDGALSDTNAHPETSISTAHMLVINIAGQDGCCDESDADSRSDTSHCGTMCHFFGVNTSSIDFRPVGEIYSTPHDHATGIVMIPSKRPPKTIL